jgi:hypothetical protein
MLHTEICKLLSDIGYSLTTHGILKIFSNYSIFQGQQKYYRPKLDNTKDILVVFRYTFLIGWIKHSTPLGRDLTPNQIICPGEEDYVLYQIY